VINNYQSVDSPSISNTIDEFEKEIDAIIKKPTPLTRSPSRDHNNIEDFIKDISPFYDLPYKKPDSPTR